MRPVLVRTLIVVAVACAAHSPASASLSKLDPRARTALGALRAQLDLARLRASRLSVTAAGELDVFVRGSVTRAELEGAGARVRSEIGGIFTAFVPVDRIEAVAALAGVQRIRGSFPVELELDVTSSVIGASALRGPGPVFAGMSGAGVLIGDVDSGVDYQHGDFDDAAGNTRLVSIWDQNPGGGGVPPPAYPYGSEWSPAQIDADVCTQVDGIGHGTHVLGIAGGDGSQTGGATSAYTYAGVAPRADLVMVSTNFNDAGVIDGVKYCFDLATARGQNAVVNLSLGSQAGPHDGTDEFEEGLAALTGPGRIIVKSAGNDRASGRHAEAFAVGAGDSITMSVTGASVGALFVIDGYYESNQNMRLQIRTPSGSIIGPLNRGTANAAYPNGTDTPNGVVYAENGFSVSQGGDYEVYMEVTGGAGDNLNGTWTFVFLPVSVTTGEVDLWRFYSSNLSATFVRGLEAQELISEPGNAEEVITVAAFATKTSWTDCNDVVRMFSGAPAVGALASFSSPGPTRDGRQKPDIAAPGTPIVSTNSFDAFPTCIASNTLVNDGANHRADQGTSMAAPHVTGAVALLLQSYGAQTPLQIKNLLFTMAKTDAQTGAVWNRDWGRGKLFLDGTVDALLSLFHAEPEAEGVTLRWRFGDPASFTSVALERAADPDGPWQRVDATPRRDADVTVVLDRTALHGTTYFYRLATLRSDGTPMVFGPIEVLAGATLERFTLERVRPNPTRGVARVDFVVPRSSSIRVSLFDLQGREIAVLAQGTYRPGRYQAVWNGTSDEARAPSGVYFVRFASPDGVLTQRVAIAR